MIEGDASLRCGISLKGADIVVGEGQNLGSPPTFGGPACGLFACKKELIRRLPGRLVAETVKLMEPIAAENPLAI